jgi:hypothetical protein
MLLIARTLGRPPPYVRTAAHRNERAVAFHPPELAIVETLMAESPGEHDVIHVPQLSVGSCPAGTWLRQICG